MLGRYMATYGQHWSSLAGGPSEDLPGGRTSAGRPKLKNEIKCLAGLRISISGKLWSLFAGGPPEDPFCRKTIYCKTKKKKLKSIKVISVIKGEAKLIHSFQ